MYIAEYKFGVNASIIIGTWKVYPSDQNVIDEVLNYWKRYFSKMVSNENDIHALSNDMFFKTIKGKFEVIKLDIIEV